MAVMHAINSRTSLKLFGFNEIEPLSCDKGDTTLSLVL